MPKCRSYLLPGDQLTCAEPIAKISSAWWGLSLSTPAFLSPGLTHSSAYSFTLFEFSVFLSYCDLIIVIETHATSLLSSIHVFPTLQTRERKILPFPLPGRGQCARWAPAPPGDYTGKHRLAAPLLQ